LESDLLTLARFLKTRTSPLLSPASSGLAAPSFGRVACSCSARGQHAPGRSLPILAHEGYDMISKARLVVFGVSVVSDGRLSKREVPGGGAGGPHAGDGDGAFRCQFSVLVFCCWVVLCFFG
jgi:hypothetical protein